MKKQLTFIAGIISISLLLSCTSGDSPKAVAEKFLTAYGELDYETARKYGTEETAKLMDMLSGVKKLTDDVDDLRKKFVITGEKIDTDKAIVYYKEENTSTELPLILTREEGKWKVNMTKESLSDTGEDNIMDIGATQTQEDEVTAE